MQLPDTVDGYIRLQEIEFGNRLECAREPSVRAWTDASRLEGFAALARAVAPRKAILQRLTAATASAAGNLPRLVQPLG
jgi:hypothetical protein